jgi:3-keto-disaccharide hydrolase
MNRREFVQTRGAGEPRLGQRTEGSKQIMNSLIRISRVVVLAGTALTLAALPIKTLAASDVDSGFELIFDGKTLDGWQGDPKYWRVENGCLVGEVTPETILKQNSFIIWRSGRTRDFELKVEYRVSARGNSGINYRSVEVPGQPWALRGYQADIDGEDQWSGQNYEERGRTFLAMRGEMVRLEEGKKPLLTASLGDKKELQAFVKKEDWNEYHLIVRGNVMVHILNDHVMSLVIDDDVKNRRFDGLLGVQVHVGPPMKIEYRNFRLKRLSEQP